MPREQIQKNSKQKKETGYPLPNIVATRDSISYAAPLTT